MFSVKGKKAIVTGATGGLGKGFTEGLLEGGAEVIIIGSNEKVLNLAMSYQEKGFLCKGFILNIKDLNEVTEKFDDIVELLGGTLDILVNGAGTIQRHFAEEFPIEDWNKIMDINLNSVFLLCKLASNYMIKQGYGKIINIASMLSFFGGYTVCAYAASKGGVAQLTKSLANEWASKGINVNAIAPGYMESSMTKEIQDDPIRSKEILSRIPAKRWGVDKDLKGCIVFLSSSASDYLNGAIIPVDGGYLVR